MAVDVRKEFADITECPICKEKMSDTRTLPCIHTFCRKCLEKLCCKNNGTIKCPCCRNECDIPNGGIRKFPKNHFIEKLLKLRSSLKLSQIQETKLTCSFEGHKDRKDRHFAFAYYYCVECEQFMCRWCSESHSEQTLSHQILSTGCLNHREKQLEFFCKTCKLPICSKCLSVTHKSHKVCTFTEYATTSDREMETVKLIKSREIRSLQAKISNLELEKRENKTLKREIKTLTKQLPDVHVLERRYKFEKLEKEIALKKVKESTSELEEHKARHKKALEQHTKALEEHNIMHNKALAELRQKISEERSLRLNNEAALLSRRFTEVLKDNLVVKQAKIIKDLQQQTSLFVHLEGEWCSRSTNNCTAIGSVHDPILFCRICRHEMCLGCFSKSTEKVVEDRIIKDRTNNRERIIENETSFYESHFVIFAVCALLMYMLGNYSACSSTH